MVKKKDSFFQIANDLGKVVSRNQSQKRGSWFSSKMSISLFVAVLSLLFLSFLSNSPKKPLSEGVELLAEYKDNSALTLFQKYVSSVEDFQFNWRLTDFEPLVVSADSDGTRVDDIVAEYGKASEGSQFSPESFFLRYSGENDEGTVELYFRKAKDGEFRLELVHFQGFSVPDKYDFPFKEHGDKMSEDLFREFEKKEGQDKGEVLDHLLSTIEKPIDTDFAIMKSNSGVSESLTLEYSFGFYNAVVFQFEQNRDGKFVLRTTSSYPR